MYFVIMPCRIFGLQMLAIATVLLPNAASAMTLVQFFGFLNIFVGVFLTLALILYGAAVIVYFTRYGTPHRDESLKLIEFGLTILFILIILLGVVQYFQSHPGNMTYIVGTIIFLLVIWLIIYAYSGGGKEDGSPKH
jgi:cytochrome bd-type quinol oxidase subunit 2